MIMIITEKSQRVINPPSIMFAPAHINPDVRKITEIDVH